MFCDGCSRKLRRYYYRFTLLFRLRFCYRCAVQRSRYYECANLCPDFSKLEVSQLDFFHRSFSFFIGDNFTYPEFRFLKKGGD